MCLFHCLSFLGCKTLKTYEREKNNWKEKKKKKFYVTKKVHKLKSYELYHQFENDIIFFFILLSCHAANSSFMIAVSVCTTITICDLMVEIDILLACIFLSKINFFFDHFSLFICVWWFQVRWDGGVFHSNNWFFFFCSLARVRACIPISKSKLANFITKLWW